MITLLNQTNTGEYRTMSPEICLNYYGSDQHKLDTAYINYLNNERLKAVGFVNVMTTASQKSYTSAIQMNSTSQKDLFDKRLRLKLITNLINLKANYSELIEDIYTKMISVVSSIAFSYPNDVLIDYNKDESIYITVKHDDFNIYYEYFFEFDNENIQNSEVIISKYKNQFCIANWAGSYNESLIAYYKLLK